MLRQSDQRKEPYLGLILPFLFLSVIGLILSLTAHVAAVLGRPQPLGALTWLLHAGIFVVFLPTSLIPCKRKAKGVFWKAAWLGCPIWMRWITYSFCAYAMINFILCFQIAHPPQDSPRGLVNASSEIFRGFSGHWMAFYSTAAAMFYQAAIMTKPAPLASKTAAGTVPKTREAAERD